MKCVPEAVTIEEHPLRGLWWHKTQPGRLFLSARKSIVREILMKSFAMECWLMMTQSYPLLRMRGSVRSCGPPSSSNFLLALCARDVKDGTKALLQVDCFPSKREIVIVTKHHYVPIIDAEDGFFKQQQQQQQQRAIPTYFYLIAYEVLQFAALEEAQLYAHKQSTVNLYLYLHIVFRDYIFLLCMSFIPLSLYRPPLNPSQHSDRNGC